MFDSQVASTSPNQAVTTLLEAATIPRDENVSPLWIGEAATLGQRYRGLLVEQQKEFELHFCATVLNRAIESLRAVQPYLAAPNNSGLEHLKASRLVESLVAADELVSSFIDFSSPQANFALTTARELRENLNHDVRDNGSGLDMQQLRASLGEGEATSEALSDEEVAARLFIRGVSVSGKGHGLGLAIVHKLIVERLKGHVSISNRSEVGAEVCILLPKGSRHAYESELSVRTAQTLYERRKRDGSSEK